MYKNNSWKLLSIYYMPVTHKCFASINWHNPHKGKETSSWLLSLLNFQLPISKFNIIHYPNYSPGHGYQKTHTCTHTYTLPAFNIMYYCYAWIAPFMFSSLLKSNSVTN